MAGPLAGIKVVELEAIGPAPFTAMMLADMGATVLRIARPGDKAIDAGRIDMMSRGRTELLLDLKSPSDRDVFLRAIASADASIEGFRPGVMERLELGPDECLAINSRLVYGRVTGWGRDGPLAQAAGHDINYIALAGVLGAIGPANGRPVPPLNLVGDFGGGGMLLAFGVVCALLEARISGRGQVVDACMLDGAALLMSSILGLFASGMWSAKRGENFLDGGAPFYRCYRCADGRWIAIGAIESKFYRALLSVLGIDDGIFDEQWDRTQWPEQCETLDRIFATCTRDRWVELLQAADVCFAPVLDLAEVSRHPHNVARQTFGIDGRPSAAPRFSRTPEGRASATRDEVLESFGIVDLAVGT